MRQNGLVRMDSNISQSKPKALQHDGMSVTELETCIAGRRSRTARGITAQTALLFFFSILETESFSVGAVFSTFLPLPIYYMSLVIGNWSVGCRWFCFAGGVCSLTMGHAPPPASNIFIYFFSLVVVKSSQSIYYFLLFRGGLHVD